MDGGLSRVFMGVQFFQGVFFEFCGCLYGLFEVYEVIEVIYVSGLNNWSLDFILFLLY